MTQKQKNWISIASVAVFVVFCALCGWIIGVPMIRLAREPDAFRQWVDSYGIWGKLIFVGMVFLQVIVALIPGEPLEMVAGYAFGAFEGTVLTLVGIILGSAAVFLLVRRFGAPLLEVFFTSRQIRDVSFLKNPKKTRILAFLLMLIPGTPKDLLSYFAGLTNLSLSQWLLIVSVARIPSVVTSTASGGAVGAENYPLAVVMIALTALVSIAGIGYYRWLCLQERNQNDAINK